MDTTNTTLTDAITAKQAELQQAYDAAGALREEIRALQVQAEAERNTEALAAVAAELGTDVERVAAFVAKVAERSGYGVSYLVSIITGEHRVSTPGSRPLTERGWFAQ